MPIKVKSNLPAKKVLEDENIFVMDNERAVTQDIRPLRILILNLMPLKEDTEVQLLRILSNTPLQVDVTFLTTASYVGKNTPKSHLDHFYYNFGDVREKKFDGMIITGAPVELMEYEQVDYWQEMVGIMEWTKTNVTSTLHLCWGAQAGLYYHYGIKKIILPKKVFGIYPHRVYKRRTPLLRGFDDEFLAPHSRYTSIDEEMLRSIPEITVLADSPMVGTLLAIANEGKQIYIQGHLEYDRMTLDSEYKRDMAKGDEIQLPYNYYPENNPKASPILTWRAAANAFYSNWLNYYVYQQTPYKWN